MVVFHKLPGETIIGKFLCGNSVDSSGLADSRYDLEHTVGEGGGSRIQKFLLKFDAINVNFSANILEAIVIRGTLAPARIIGKFIAPHIANAKLKSWPHVEKLSAFKVLGICYGDRVGGNRFALLAASAKEKGAKESQTTRGLFLFNVVEHNSSVGYKHAVVVFFRWKATQAETFLDIKTFNKVCLVVQSG
jgi:hypothetical protein